VTASISEVTGVTAQIIPVRKSENPPHAIRVGERATGASSYTTVVSGCYCVGVIYIVGVGGWLRICSQCIGAYLVVVSSFVDEDVVIVIRSWCIEAYLIVIVLTIVNEDAVGVSVYDPFFRFWCVFYVQPCCWSSPRSR